jgi:anti-sigma factor RsiW
VSTERTSRALSCDEARELAAGFVLGALDPADEAAVRDHLATCSESHPEFATLGGVVPYLAESIEAVEPPAELRARLRAAIAAEVNAAQPAPPVRSQAVSQRDETFVPPVSIVAERERRRSAFGLVAAASAIAAVLMVAVLGAWNLQLRSQLDSTQAYQAAVDRVLAIAAEPGGQAAVLRPPQQAGPTGLAAIGADGSVAIVMRGLGPTTGAEVYEAWVIGADQKPVAIGELVVDRSGRGVLASARIASQAGVTVALTREPHAAPSSPTLPILSNGVTNGSSQG